MYIENKYSEELLEYIKDWAWDSWDCGQGLSCDDLDEFRKLLIEDDFNINIEDAKELFNYYMQEFELAKESFNEDC